MPRSIDDLLAGYPPAIQALASHTRQFVRRVLPDVQESADATAPLVAFSHGPGYRGLVATMILSRTGVKLGLVCGASLEDPRGLLEGAGKVHRHIALRTEADLRKPGVSALLKASSRLCHERLSKAARPSRKRTARATS
jgi:hypothetical protein